MDGLATARKFNIVGIYETNRARGGMISMGKVGIELIKVVVKIAYQVINCHFHAVAEINKSHFIVVDSARRFLGLFFDEGDDIINK